MIEFQTLVTATLGAKRIGIKIAQVNSEEQAEFFEGLALGFERFSKSDKDGMQMLWIKDCLSQRAKDFIKKLAEYAST